jgi:DNA-binding GntR family transcriptional regulator
MTVRSVVNELVNEGILFRIQGKGTYVAPQKLHMGSTAYAGIREQLERMGPAHADAPCSVPPPRKPERKPAACWESNPMHMFNISERLRIIGDQPVSIHRSYLPQNLVPNLDRYDLEGRQLCHILQEHYGLRAPVQHADAGIRERPARRSGNAQHPEGGIPFYFSKRSTDWKTGRSSSLLRSFSGAISLSFSSITKSTDGRVRPDRRRKRCIIKKLKGIFVPAATAFDANGDVDPVRLVENYRAWQRTAIRGLMILGTNGECKQLTDRESLLVVETAAQARQPDKTAHRRRRPGITACDACIHRPAGSACRAHRLPVRDDAPTFSRSS